MHHLSIAWKYILRVFPSFNCMMMLDFLLQSSHDKLDEESNVTCLICRGFPLIFHTNVVLHSHLSHFFSKATDTRCDETVIVLVNKVSILG